MCLCVYMCVWIYGTRMWTQKRHTDIAPIQTNKSGQLLYCLSTKCPPGHTTCHSSHHHNAFMANGVLWQTNVVSSVEVVGVEIVFGTENHRRKIGNIHRDIKNYANLSYIFFCAKMPQYSHYKHCLQEDLPHFGL